MNNKWRRHPLPTIGLLLAVFIIPILIARYTFNQHDTFGRTTNYGELINPPQKLAAIPLLNLEHQRVDQQSLGGKWLYLYIGAGHCEQVCESMLYKMRQVRLAAGKNMNRIERAILTPVQVENPTLQTLLDGQYKGTKHFEIKVDQLTLAKDWLYLVDPLGNIMMRYAPSADPSRMLKDIERLLKVSQIG